MTAPIGVLLMAYGTPQTLAEIEPYYTDIRGGRSPSPELLAELTQRYEAIGGRSPLLEITRAQATGLQEALDGLFGQGRSRVYIGMRHWQPRIAEAVAAMRLDGVERGIGIVLAPHYSAMSTGRYQEMAIAAAKGGPQMTFVAHWHLQPAFLRLLAQRVEEALSRLPVDLRAEAVLVFTAHSLPQRIVASGDPYPQQLEETARAVSAMLGRTAQVGWQSAGRTADPWIGPDILDQLHALKADGARAVVVCPCGFVADHLEILYDLDIEASALAVELGMAFARTCSPNADAQFVQALADVVLGHLAESVLAP